MSHIFISYKKEEQATARLLASRLTEAGYDVWWDASLLGGARFAKEIERVLNSTPVAIILWSRQSAESEWVQAEAEIARKRQTAISVLIDDVSIDQLPMLYRSRHAVDLRGWSGDPQAPGYTQILKSVVDKIGTSAGPVLSDSAAQAKLAVSSEEAAMWADITESKTADAADYQLYLRRFGEAGQFGAIARMRLDRMRRHNRRTTGLWAAGVLTIAIIGVFSLLATGRLPFPGTASSSSAPSSDAAPASAALSETAPPPSSSAEGVPPPASQSSFYMSTLFPPVAPSSSLSFDVSSFLARFGTNSDPLVTPSTLSRLQSSSSDIWAGLDFSYEPLSIPPSSSSSSSFDFIANWSVFFPSEPNPLLASSSSDPFADFNWNMSNPFGDLASSAAATSAEADGGLLDPNWTPSP